MIQTIEEAQKRESKRLRIPARIGPFEVGYRIVDKHGNIFSLKSGATIFSLPSLARKAIQKEFGRDDPNFDVEEHFVEEVAIVDFVRRRCRRGSGRTGRGPSPRSRRPVRSGPPRVKSLLKILFLLVMKMQDY